LNLPDLKKNLLNIYKKNRQKIFDIVLFGSVTREKQNISDVDIAVIFIDSVDDKLLYDINKSQEHIHINYLKLTELYSESLWKIIIREGESIVHKKSLDELFGLQSYGLFSYDLTGMKRKSRFSQVLRGYKSESILKKVDGTIIKPGVLLVPTQHTEYFREFLNTWNAKYKLKFIYGMSID